MALCDQLKTGNNPRVNQQFQLRHFIQRDAITVKSAMAMSKNVDESDKFNIDPKQSGHKIQTELLFCKIKELAQPTRGVRSQGTGHSRAEGSSSDSGETPGYPRTLATLPSPSSSV